MYYTPCFRLYNKDAIIEYLLDKTAERPNTEAVVHIRALKVRLNHLLYMWHKCVGYIYVQFTCNFTQQFLK